LSGGDRRARRGGALNGSIWPARFRSWRFDKDPKTLDLIEEGQSRRRFAQSLYVMSYYGLKFLDDLDHNALKSSKDWPHGAGTSFHELGGYRNSRGG